MKVLVIGAGNMGSGFVKQLSAAGHRVNVTARTEEKPQSLSQRASGGPGKRGEGRSFLLGYGAALGTAIAPSWMRKA